jgi:hypothetical protein
MGNHPLTILNKCEVLIYLHKKTNSVGSLRKRNIPTERPRLTYVSDHIMNPSYNVVLVKRTELSKLLLKA